MIYKILTLQEWLKFQEDKIFHGSPLDLKDGFIHCSMEDQYPAIIEKYFKDHPLIILLQIDVNNLPKGSLKIESNRPGGLEYPHVYSALPLSAVVSWKELN